MNATNEHQEIKSGMCSRKKLEVINVNIFNPLMQIGEIYRVRKISNIENQQGQQYYTPIGPTILHTNRANNIGNIRSNNIACSQCQQY